MQELVIKASSDINIKAGCYHCYVAPGQAKAQMPIPIKSRPNDKMTKHIGSGDGRIHYSPGFYSI